ncbi:MAG: helix-turn-helix domain-containing protein [Chloroflexi bacterium]|nr:helix-turn-helix domain-containing protein [Chloroflexota bacterium]
MHIKNELTVPAPQPPNTYWLDLSAAADYLGVHFTTLRRWTDDGKVPCIRTPGGRRRYRLAELTAFLASLQQGATRTLAPALPGAGLARLLPPKHIGLSGEPWYGRLDENTRAAMRSGGQQLMAVLMQYATRSNGGEAFLAEGQRLAGAYGTACHRSGLSLIEMLRAFLLVRRSINDSVHQAGALAGVPDADTWRLYERMTTFLDALLIATVAGFEDARTRALPATHPTPSHSA